MNQEQVAVVPDQATLVALWVLSLIMLLVFGYSAQAAYCARKKYRDSRSLRGLFQSWLLFGGMVVIFLGRTSTAFFPTDPAMRDVLRFSGVILSGAIIAIGMGVAWSYHKDP